MILRRPGSARGATRGEGIERRHAFSSGQYHDPAWMGFGPLRAFNEVDMAPGASGAMQHLGNMELLTWVVSGTLVQRDSLASDVVQHAGELLWTGAGHGIDHAVANGAQDAPVRFLQAWLQPDRVNAPPARAQRAFEPATRRGRWTLLASPDGADGSLPIRQEARLLAALLEPGNTLAWVPDPARRYWLHVVRGGIEAGGEPLSAGDALGLSGEEAALLLRGRGPGMADVLLFDLP